MSRQAPHAVRPDLDSGFTLVEMLVVLAIMAIVAGSASSSFRNPRADEQIRPLAARLVAELRAARTLAISSNRDIAFAFDAATRSYKIDGIVTTAAVSPSINVTLLTAKEFVRDRSEAKIVFFADGSSTGGRLTLTQGNQSIPVLVPWLTGFAQIEASKSGAPRP
jgi:general secretion pathway protein H